MPRRAAKTRYQVMVDGAPKELFSVREINRDQLLILSPASERMELGDVNDSIVEEHISVHGGNPNGSTTVKRTLEINTGPLVETAMYVPARSEGWCRPIFARACLDLTPERYNAKGRAKDTVVWGPSFAVKSWQLIYCLLVSEGPWPVALLKNGPHVGLSIIPFQRYTVSVMYTLHAAGSHPHGQDMAFATSSPRVNKGEFVQFPPQDKPWSVPAVFELAIQGIFQAAMLNVERAQKRIMDAGYPRMDELDQAARYFVPAAFPGTDGL